MSSIHTKSTKTNVIAPFSETKWLILSASVCFGVPFALALSLQEYGYALHFGNIIILSANYWRNARYNWHRTMDVTYVRFNACVFGYDELLYVRQSGTTTSIVFTMLLIYGMYLSYNKSIALYYKKRTAWVRYHMLFHFLTAYGQTLFLLNRQNNKLH